MHPTLESVLTRRLTNERKQSDRPTTPGHKSTISDPLKFTNKFQNSYLSSPAMILQRSTQSSLISSVENKKKRESRNKLPICNNLIKKSRSFIMPSLEHIAAPKHISFRRQRVESPEQKRLKHIVPKSQSKKAITPREIILQHRITMKKHTDESVTKKYCAKYVQI